MENSIFQSAYQVREFLRCEGYDEKMASKAEQMYIERELAEIYEDYLPLHNILTVYMPSEKGLAGVISSMNPLLYLSHPIQMI